MAVHRKIAAKPAKERAVTLAERLYHSKVIDENEWLAAGKFLNQHFLLDDPGVSVAQYRYDGPRGATDAWCRATTAEHKHVAGNISNRSRRQNYADMLFAMAGVETDEGEKVIDTQKARILICALTETRQPPKQIEIGQARANYASDKQASAVGASFVKEALRALALHLRFVEGDAVQMMDVATQ